MLTSPMLCIMCLLVKLKNLRGFSLPECRAGKCALTFYREQKNKTWPGLSNARQSTRNTVQSGAEHKQRVSSSVTSGRDLPWRMDWVGWQPEGGTAQGSSVPFLFSIHQGESDLGKPSILWLFTEPFFSKRALQSPQAGNVTFQKDFLSKLKCLVM